MTGEIWKSNLITVSTRPRRQVFDRQRRNEWINIFQKGFPMFTFRIQSFRNGKVQYGIFAMRDGRLLKICVFCY